MGRFGSFKLITEIPIVSIFILEYLRHHEDLPNNTRPVGKGVA